MTPAEYVQLNAFARTDGAMLSLLWISSFTCYIASIGKPFYGLAAMLLALLTPFFVVSRLRNYRDYGLEGCISVMRGWAYIILIFCYAGLLLAAAQYVYFTYVDHGYLSDKMQEMLAMPDVVEMQEQYGVTEQMNESLRLLQDMRPIDLVLQVMSSNIFMGIVLGLPIAVIMRKSIK